MTNNERKIGELLIEIENISSRILDIRQEMEQGSPIDMQEIYDFEKDRSAFIAELEDILVDIKLKYIETL